MRKPLALSAYLALRQTSAGTSPPARQPRPKGALVWVHCADPERLHAVQALAELVTQDGDHVTVLTTCLDASERDGLIVEAIPADTPAAAAAFLDHWRPDAVVWLEGALMPALISQAVERGIPRILLDVSETQPDLPGKTLVPGLGRAVLGSFDHAFSVDKRGTARLARAGLDRAAIRRAERFDPGGLVAPVIEAERAEIATALATRPVWLAAGVPKHELPLMVTAYRLASQRRHQLVAVVCCDEEFIPAAKTAFEHAGLSVCDYLTGELPTNGTQVVLAETETLGLWYRLAPLTYIGGTLRGGQILDPFDAAALGSVVIHGLKTVQHVHRFRQLGAASACRMVQSETELGRVVEALLSPDRAAKMAHAAWDVTSRGAETGRLVAEVLRGYLDGSET